MGDVVRTAVWVALGPLLTASQLSCRSPATFPGTDPTPIHATSAAAAAAASNRFGFDVYARTRRPNQNVIFSPISASLALAMTAAGAKGETLAQMSHVLHVDTLANAHVAFADLLASFPNSPDTDSAAAVPTTIESVVPGMARAAPSSREAVLHVADRVWVQAHWAYREDFLSILRDRYGSPPGELDFEGAFEPARVEINAWVKKQTRGRIENLLPPRSVDRWTRLVLTNAVYFKACWALPFAPRETREEDFATPKERVRTNMMRQVSQFGYGRLDGVAAVELTYFGSSMSMVVILPEDPEGLADVENRIGHDYDRWLAALASKRVDLWLPQWQETQDFVLDEILKGLGMPIAFDRHADFSGMTDMPTQEPGKFHIGTVIQRAFVDVDEVGTEASAATAVVISISDQDVGPPPAPVVFHADHPFLYVIRERNTGAVLFVGRVVDPRRHKVSPSPITSSQ